MEECRADGLTKTSLSKIAELKTMTMEVETVYVEYTTVVQQVSKRFSGVPLCQQTLYSKYLGQSGIETTGFPDECTNGAVLPLHFKLFFTSSDRDVDAKGNSGVYNKEYRRRARESPRLPRDGRYDS